MKMTHLVLLAAGLVAGLTIASQQANAAGPMVAPGAIGMSSAGTAVTMLEPTVVVVHRRRPVVVHRHVVRRPVVHRRVIVR